MNIAVTPAEYKAGKMAQKKVDRAVQAVCEDGYVVVDDAVDHACLDVLRGRMDDDTRELIAAKHWGGAGRVSGHLQQGPPPFAPYVFSDVVCNPLAVQVTKALLGEGLFNGFYNGNTNTPGSGLQPVHRDMPLLWPNWKGAHPPMSVVVNISPMDVHEHNGCTEIWPGSHMIPDEITDEVVKRRSAEVPSVRAVAKKGSFIVRDMRLWHRGVPNESQEFRHMIAMIYQIRWYRRGQKLMFQKGCEDAFISKDLDHNVEFVDGPMDYLYGKYGKPKGQA